MGRPSALDLELKQLPSCELAASAFDGKALWVRYGSAGPAAARLRERLERGGEALWTPEGQESNIRLRRAFHDQLGVQQIVFVFCDDLLRTVYELPWWDEWAPELLPVLEAAGVSGKKVIRCLLARLPAGVTIPVHHDTGRWSTLSHRVHVPLVTSGQDGDPNKEVVFKVGHTEAAMARVPFCEGDVVELNNRAKHFVQNNWDTSRVHMIFDYVDEPERFPRCRLDPGQQLFQTRRSIFLEDPGDFGASVDIIEDQAEREQNSMAVLELVKREGKVCAKTFSSKLRRYADGECGEDETLCMLCDSVRSREALCEMFDKHGLARLLQDPERSLALSDAYARFLGGPRFFFVLGAMKCGTTSLYDYIAQHPGVQRAAQKEPHIFDWRWDLLRAAKLTPAQEAVSAAIAAHMEPREDPETFAKFLHAFNPSSFLLDPSLEVTGEATPSYLLGGVALAQRMKQVAGEDLRFVVILRDPTKRAYSQYCMITDPSGTEAQKRRRGHTAGQSFESLVEDDLAALRRCGADDPEVDPDDFEREYLAKQPSGSGNYAYAGRGLYALQLKLWFKVFPRERFLVLRLDDLGKDVDAEMARVFRFLGLPPVPIPDPTPKNTRRYDPVDAATEANLRAFYEPHNRALAALLGDDRFNFAD